jgi:hypothetical protein
MDWPSNNSARKTIPGHDQATGKHEIENPEAEFCVVPINKTGDGSGGTGKIRPIRI